MRAGLCLLGLGIGLLGVGCRSSVCEGPGCTFVPPVVAFTNAPPAVLKGGCDTTKAQALGGCAVAESDGVFVATTGDDTAAGTPAAPLKTIGAGVAMAAKSATRVNVYVCGGAYDERVTIASATSGVAIHGGFSCDGGTWTWADAPTSLAPRKPWPQATLTVRGVAVVVEDLAIDAPTAAGQFVDGSGTGSTGVLLYNAPGATLRRAHITAGDGAPGLVGFSDTTKLGTAPAGMDSPAPQAAGDAVTNTCANGTSVGGQGGDQSRAPQAGTPKIANASPTAGAAGTVVINGCSESGGKDGWPGLVGMWGAGASTVGTLDDKGAFVGTIGGDGQMGGVGQGGGGAWGNFDLNGGGGGAGGCGGRGGGGGGAGGASIAIVSMSSALRLIGTRVASGNGGAGADGGLGQQGQLGAPGGKGRQVQLGAWCSGGTGGSGGYGGEGGGGAGGVTYGIAYVKTAPEIDAASEIMTGKPGRGGGVENTQAVDGEAALQKKL